MLNLIKVQKFLKFAYADINFTNIFTSIHEQEE